MSMKKISLLMMVFGLLIGGSAYARDGKCGMGKGRGECHPMRQVDCLLNNGECLSNLGVTEEQSAALREIELRFEQDSIALEADVKTVRLAMKKLMKENSTDREAIFAAMDAVNAAELKWKKAELGAWLDARKVFTAEQQEALKKMMCDRRECRGMKGPGKDRCERSEGKGCKGGMEQHGDGCGMKQAPAEDESVHPAH